MKKLLLVLVIAAVVLGLVLVVMNAQKKIETGSESTSSSDQAASSGEPSEVQYIVIEKKYGSIEAMHAGYETDGVPEGGYVLIDTGSVEDPDNAKLYIKGADGYELVIDLSGATGAQGVTGADGNGIESIAKTATEGNADTYTITFTNGSTTTFVVTNGEDGADGQDGAQGAKGDKGDKGAKGDQGEQGEKGEQGAPGVSIVGAEVNANGYLILTLSDGSKITAGKVSDKTDPASYIYSIDEGWTVVSNTDDLRSDDCPGCGRILYVAEDQAGATNCPYCAERIYVHDYPGNNYLAIGRYYPGAKYYMVDEEGGVTEVPESTYYNGSSICVNLAHADCGCIYLSWVGGGSGDPICRVCDQYIFWDDFETNVFYEG